MSKFQRIGQVRKQTNKKTGKEYKELVLEKAFLDKAPKLLSQCYTDKKGDKHLYLFDAGEKSPDFVLADVCVKLGDE